MKTEIKVVRLQQCVAQTRTERVDVCRVMPCEPICGINLRHNAKLAKTDSDSLTDSAKKQGAEQLLLLLLLAHHTQTVSKSSAAFSTRLDIVVLFVCWNPKLVSMFGSYLYESRKDNSE